MIYVYGIKKRRHLGSDTINLKFQPRHQAGKKVLFYSGVLILSIFMYMLFRKENLVLHFREFLRVYMMRDLGSELISRNRILKLMCKHFHLSRHYVNVLLFMLGARWRSGRASDSESIGPVFDPHRRHRVVSLCKTH